MDLQSDRFKHEMAARGLRISDLEKINKELQI